MSDKMEWAISRGELRKWLKEILSELLKGSTNPTALTPAEVDRTVAKLTSRLWNNRYLKNWPDHREDLVLSYCKSALKLGKTGKMDPAELIAALFRLAWRKLRAQSRGLEKTRTGENAEQL